MKITKLKNGWRLNLTDTEMDILLEQINEDRMAVDSKYKTDTWSDMRTAFAQVPSILSYFSKR